MWLFAQRGFLSIVRHKDDDDLLLVRARVKGDIERFWPRAKVERTDERDYLYRTELIKDEVADVLWREVKQIEYINFKASIEDKSRGPWYMRVWETMYDLQYVFRNREDRK